MQRNVVKKIFSFLLLNWYQSILWGHDPFSVPFQVSRSASHHVFNEVNLASYFDLGGRDGVHFAARIKRFLSHQLIVPIFPCALRLIRVHPPCNYSLLFEICCVLFDFLLTDLSRWFLVCSTSAPLQIVVYCILTVG